MKLTKGESETLNILMKSSRGLDAFSLFRRTKVSFTEFSKTIRELTKYDFITEIKDDFYTITKDGQTYITKANRIAKDRPWRDVPKRFLGKKIKNNDFYIPSLKLLDKKTFNIPKKEID
jgi:predicted transcriptional regulator